MCRVSFFFWLSYQRQRLSLDTSPFFRGGCFAEAIGARSSARPRSVGDCLAPAWCRPNSRMSVVACLPLALGPVPRSFVVLLCQFTL